ncbi:fibroblast growth factor 2-like isoform X1 [Montipora capricornis]|uniref:fibroblast growth factor 2-like isoform X1 n=1 Tax=Montipora capricornis TaxID=246305 RepID=UPI0035F124AC
MDKVNALVSWFAIICVLIGYSQGLSLNRFDAQPKFHQATLTSENLNQAKILDKMELLSGSPTNTKIVKLYNKNGFFLKITNTTKQTGTRSAGTRESLIVMESMGSSIVRFKGVVSNLYLCMDDEGVCHVKTIPTDECLFKERLGENYFHTYASLKYSGKNAGNVTQEYYLAIKKSGKLKHGINTAAIQKSVDFLVMTQ